ncbi:MAG: hypothetical protein GX465_15955 [Acidobacteria bacterium]|jgi:hypothetical protein|nr:hypothetical protein [Acidobacteriota bacterium]
MRKKSLPLVAFAIMLISGCIDSTNSFDLSSSIIKDLNLGDNYILTCHIPKDTSVNYYKLLEDRKKGYSVRGAYLTNEQGRTDFYIYELTAGTKSLEYLFGDSEEAYKEKALESWNKRQLASKGYDQDFTTYQSSPMKEINGVKTAKVLRTIGRDQRGNLMIAESCWFDYANAFWFITTTWPKDYFDTWWSSDLILRYR